MNWRFFLSINRVKRVEQSIAANNFLVEDLFTVLVAKTDQKNVTYAYINDRSTGHVHECHNMNITVNVTAKAVDS